jgi:hypothetical protein
MLYFMDNCRTYTNELDPMCDDVPCRMTILAAPLKHAKHHFFVFTGNISEYPNYISFLIHYAGLIVGRKVGCPLMASEK